MTSVPSRKESDHIRPFLRIGTIDATEGCDFFVQWALWKNIFSIVALLTGHGFLMIYDRGSVCDHLGSKNCKLLCGCPTFISVHVPISISMDMCKCGTRLKQDRAHSRGPALPLLRGVWAPLTVNPSFIAFKSVCMCARMCFIIQRSRNMAARVRRSRVSFRGAMQVSLGDNGRWEAGECLDGSKLYFVVLW